MLVHGKKLLLEFQRRHAAVKSAVDIWLDETEKAAWKGPVDIKRDYPSASFLAGNRVIFNIKGNHCRLVVVVAYVQGMVKIDWIGTHAEYSKRKWS